MVIHRRNCEQHTGWTSSKNAWNVRQVQLLNAMSLCSSTVICLICPVRFEFFFFFFNFLGLNEFVVHRHFPPLFDGKELFPPPLLHQFCLACWQFTSSPRPCPRFFFFSSYCGHACRVNRRRASGWRDRRHWTFSSQREKTNNKQQNVHFFFFFWLFLFCFFSWAVLQQQEFDNILRWTQKWPWLY